MTLRGEPNVVQVRHLVAEGNRTECDVCGARLCGRAGKTGLCYACRQSGARFARDWMQTLSLGGASAADIAAVVGTTPATVRSRMSDRRSGRL